MKRFFLRPLAVAWLLTTPVPSLRADPESEDLRRADAELNAVYQKALGAMPDAGAKEKLREAQRAWIAYRDAEVAFQRTAGIGQGGLKMTETELTEERTKHLRDLVGEARNDAAR